MALKNLNLNEFCPKTEGKAQVEDLEIVFDKVAQTNEETGYNSNFMSESLKTIYNYDPFALECVLTDYEIPLATANEDEDYPITIFGISSTSGALIDFCIKSSTSTYVIDSIANYGLASGMTEQEILEEYFGIVHDKEQKGLESYKPQGHKLIKK